MDLQVLTHSAMNSTEVISQREHAYIEATREYVALVAKWAQTSGPDKDNLMVQVDTAKLRAQQAYTVWKDFQRQKESDEVANALVKQPVAELDPAVLSEEVAEVIRSAAAGCRKFLGRHTVEIGGLLMASREGYPLNADGIEFVPSEHLYGPAYRLSCVDREVLRTQSAGVAASGARIVGYFRTCIRGEFEVLPEDAEIVRELLPEVRIMAIAKALPMGKAAVRLFRAGEDGTWSKYRELTLRNASLMPSWAKGLLLKASPSPQKFFKPAFYAMAALLALLNINYLIRDYGRSKMVPSSPDLGLSVDLQEDDLHVTWNRSIPAVRFAKSGKLTIDDDGQHREFVMDARQIAEGSVLYAPDSSDVSFRMEVQGGESQSATGSFRVFNIVKPQTLRANMGVDSPESPQEMPVEVSPAVLETRNAGMRSIPKRTLTAKEWEPLLAKTPRTQFGARIAALDAPPMLAADTQPQELPLSSVEPAILPANPAPPPRHIPAKVLHAVARFFAPKE
jgi:hypothetical protein